MTPESTTLEPAEPQQPLVFERITTINPAYDCIANQPCQVAGLWPDMQACSPEPSGSNHGRCDAWMFFTLRSAIADLTIAMMTGWHVPETPPDMRLPVVLSRIGMPRAAHLDFHSTVPISDGQKPDSIVDCPRWPGQACYSECGYTMAEEAVELLVRKGSDAVWTWLENLHTDTFPGR